MKSASALAFLALCLVVSCQADISIPQYIYWKKADINEWHQYFPMRALNEEQQTNALANTAVNSMSNSLADSLSSIVAFQTQELQIAELLMNDTSAQGCVLGIANYMSDAIQNAMTDYDDCAADAISKLQRLNATWNTVRTTYLAAYQRALKGINVCAKTYPNQDSIERLKSCVESMFKNYFVAANATVSAMSPSPSMAYFQNIVVDCATTAAENVTTAGYEFLNMLVECAALSGGAVDPTTYQAELDQWKGYNATLSSQIASSQNVNYEEVAIVAGEMQSYYNLQKNMLETYVIDSRGLSYYLNLVYSLLAQYYNTITQTTIDNPGDPTCTTNAKSTLDNVAYLGAVQSLTCDLNVVNETKRLIAGVNNNFLRLNTIMPGVGNAAILNCFSQGYIFAPNTISDCFNLVTLQFNITYLDNNAVIVQDVATLTGYESFFSGDSLPCGGTSLQSLLLGAGQALFDLQRCLYITSGTDYPVTTPPANITTVTPASSASAATTNAPTITTTAVPT